MVPFQIKFHGLHKFAKSYLTAYTYRRNIIVCKNLEQIDVMSSRYVPHIILLIFFRVRTLNKMTEKYVKMSLQLYQVDYKSYLLDFKSLSGEREDMDDETPSPIAPPLVLPTQPQGHHTMEFFEMCAALIIQLAR